MVDAPLLVWMRPGRTIDPGAALLGGKAAALMRLVTLHQPVPAAAVLTTAAYAAVAATPPIRALVDRLGADTGEFTDDEIDRVFLDAPLPGAVDAAVSELAAGYTGRVAVRSSATAEDLSSSAFAGQYRTVLDVEPADLERAVRLVWASLWHRSPREYRRLRAIDADAPAMAVLVMEMIDPDVAGVLFTRDPVGDATNLRLETVVGSGEALVSGAVTPDAHSWLRSEAALAAAVELGPTAGELVERGLMLEEAWRAPLDVEFAIDPQGRLWIVQVRPVTALARSPTPDAELTRTGIAEMLPGVLPPLVRASAGRYVESGFRALLSGLGADLGTVAVDHPFLQFRRSRALLDRAVLRDVVHTLPGGSVGALDVGDGVEHPGRARRTTAGQVARVLRRRHAAVVESEIVLRAVDLLVADDGGRDGASLGDLLARWERVHDLGARTTAAEMEVAALATAAYEGVQRTLARHVGNERARTLTQRLTVRPHDGRRPLDRAMHACGIDPARPLSHEDWAEVLARSGSRSVFGGPTWSDDPDLARMSCTGPAGAGRDDGRPHRSVAATAGLAVANLPRWRRRFLLREAADAAELLDRRERTKQALFDLGGIAHRLTLTLADRLVVHGVLDAAEDVWLLTPTELADAVTAGEIPDLTERRVALAADREAATAATGPTGSGRGWPAAPGTAIGPAVVVDVPRADSIRDGDVIVARTTDAGWAPLFAHAAAIVVEEGGPLSHAAIVARELGVPAVVNVPGIVDRIRSAGPDVVVEVDGTTGEVSIVDPAPRLLRSLAPTITLPDDEPRLGVFVTGLISASAVLGVVVSMTEAVSSARGHRRTLARSAAPAEVVADVVRHGTGRARQATIGLPPPHRYGQTAAATIVGGALFALFGVAQYADGRDGGRIGWLVAALSTVWLATLVGALALVARRRWPDVPPIVRRLPPSPHARTRPRERWAEMPAFHRRWVALFGWTAIALLVSNLLAPTWLHAVDESIYDAIGAPDPDPWGPAWFGMYFGRPQIVIPAALVVALFTVRCRVLAVAYPLTIMFGGLLNLGLGHLVGKERPPFGAHADQTDSFPSGHAIEVTLLLGLVPLAVAVLFRSRWIGVLVRVVASGVLVVMLVDGLREGSHWPSDHLAGFAIAMSAVVAVHALARTPSLHRSCSRCPAMSLLPDRGTDREGSIGVGRGVVSFLARRRPLLPLAPGVVRLLHPVSLLWALGVVGALELAGSAGWLDHRPGFAAYELTARPLFVGLFVLGTALAWKWEIVGGMLSTFTAAGILVWYGRQLVDWQAATVFVAFAVPGLAWLLLDLHDQRPRLAVLGVVIAMLSGTAGFTVGDAYWDDLFGPTHPDSTAELPAGSRVDWIWTGTVTSTSATIVAKPDHPGDWTALVVERATGEVVADVAGRTDGEVVRFDVSGLEPDTDYRVQLTDGTDAAAVEEATFGTFPAGRADVTIAVGSCMRVGTNGAVFDAIAALEPTLFVHAGDFHYANIGDDDPDEFRAVMDVNLSRPGPSSLFRTTPIAYVWDDHDYGANNADATSPSRPAALEVYRQYVPSYTTNGPSDPINQAFDVGDVRVVMTDPRSARTPSVPGADATMLGAEQLSWLKSELLAARDTHSLTVWVSPVGWIGEPTPGGDAWGGYSAERRDLANFIVDHDIERLVMLSGDAHMVAIDDGTNTGYADDGGPSFPVLHAAALDRPGHVKGGPYSEGAVPGGGQFGLVEISDVDAGVRVRLSGRDWTGATLLSYEVTFPDR